MKTRIITAAVLVPILFLLVLVAPKIVAAIVFSMLHAIAAYELLYRTRLVRHVRLVVYSCIMAAAVCMWSYARIDRAYLMIGLMVFTVLLFSEMRMNHVKVRVEMICMCYVSGFVVPYMLSAVIRILVMENGADVIMIPFVVGFLSDAGAYFVGIKFGKHKLAPVVSPNKTLEGVGGGLLCAMVGMVIYGLIMQLALGYRVNYGLAILYGLAGSGAGVFGDLCFSIIKRQTGIKDYGNLIPGHGGVLDRFDSMMMVAPLMETMLILLPLAEVAW